MESLEKRRKIGDDQDVSPQKRRKQTADFRRSVKKPSPNRAKSKQTILKERKSLAKPKSVYTSKVKQQAKTNPKLILKSKPKTKLSPLANTMPRPQAKVKTQSNARLNSKSQRKAKLQDKIETNIKSKPTPQTKAKAKSNPNVKPKTKLTAKSRPRPDSNAKPKAKSIPKPKTKGKGNTKAKIKLQNKAKSSRKKQTKTKSKHIPQTKVKTQQKTGTKAKSNQKLLPQIKLMVKSGPKPSTNAKPKTKYIPKPQTKGKGNTKAKIKLQNKAKSTYKKQTRANSKHIPQTKVKTQQKPGTKAKVKSKSNEKFLPQIKLMVKSGPKPATNAKPKTNSIPKPQTKGKRNTKAKNKLQNKAKSIHKKQTKAKSKHIPQTKLKTQQKSGTKAKSKSNQKFLPQIKLMVKSGSKPQTKAKSMLKEQTKAKPKQATKSKSEPKNVPKATSKMKKTVMTKSPTNRKMLAKGTKKTSITKSRDRKKKMKKVAKGRAKLDPNRKLVPNPKIELISKDPMFEVKHENSMPEVSKVVQCKRAIRAVLTNDMPLLKQLLEDTKRVPSVFLQRSIAVQETALGYAIKANNQPFIRAFLNELKNKPMRCEMPVHSLQKENTGSYNFRSLGHAVRAINVARGGREGQDAFLKDSLTAADQDDMSIAKKLATSDASLSTVDLVCQKSERVSRNVGGLIYLMVRRGNRKVAGELFKRYMNRGYGLTQLHYEVLLSDKPSELSPFKPVQAKKKPHGNCHILPVHCAAINPNPKILERLLNAMHDVNIGDYQGKKIIHYAAACTGSGPLELLLQRSTFADQADKQGNTPLMIAASLNRMQNIEVLTKKIKSDEKAKTGVFCRNKKGQTPLHIAAENGQNDAVRTLLKHGANLQATLSAGMNKLTPFMVACEQGHLQTVKLLAECGAILDQRDKLKRTPLMLASMNGHCAVAAFLLHKGCNPNASDTSGNTSLHYATAYGWWFVLKLLLSAGADPNALNDWKVPPLAVAFMKGHVGCADLLLEDSNADVNFRDADGWTIVMLTVSQFTPEMWEQLKYLVEEKNASVTLKDANDWTALHHLAAAKFQEGPDDKKEERKKICVDMASYLISKGCDIHSKTSDGTTALDVALKMNIINIALVKFFLENGCQLHNMIDSNGENLLHRMAENSISTDQLELLNIIIDNMENVGSPTTNDLSMESESEMNSFVKELAQSRNSKGFTPLLKWMLMYHNRTSSRNNDGELEKARAFLKRFLEVSKCNVDARVLPKEGDWGVHDGKTALHFLCELSEKPDENSDFPALNLVLSWKPDINIKDKEGFTPLILALNKSNVALVRKLVRAGSDINVKSIKDQATPLIIALRKDLFELVDTLVNPSTVNSSDRSELTPLHYAAMSHHNIPSWKVCGVIQKLLDNGADVQAKDSNGRTPLHYASRAYVEDKDPTTNVLVLLLNNKADVFIEDSEGRMPIHYLFFDLTASYCDDKSTIDPIEAVSLMKDAMGKERIGHPDKNGQTPIHAAALRGAIISLMDMAGCVSNMDMKDNLGNTPLSMACIGEHISVVIFLLQQGADISVNVTRPEVLKAEEDERARKKREEEERKKSGHIWLWKALRRETVFMPTVTESLFRRVVQNQWHGILFLLMDRLEKSNVPCITPIKAAIEEQRFQMALSLISKSQGHGLDGVDGKRQNLLHVLAFQRADEQANKVAEELLSIERNLSCMYDQFRCTPLTYAVLSENLELAKILVGCMNPQEREMALTSKDLVGRNPLAASFWRGVNFNTDLVRWLVGIGASLNEIIPVPLWQMEGAGPETIRPRKLEEWFHQRDDHPVVHLTPLLAALRMGKLVKVKFLLDIGADPNLAGEDGLTPLMYAVKKNDIDLVQVLVNHKYDATKINSMPSRTSTTKKRKKAEISLGSFGVKQWKSGGANDATLNRVNMEEDDVEEEEAEEMDHDGIQQDIENVGNQGINDFKKINLAATDSRGRTVIHHMMCTCEYGTYQNEAMLKMFHGMGVPLDTRDNDGKTPLDYALDAGSHVMAELLQRLQGIKKPQMKTPTLKKSTWTDGCNWDGEPSIDFREDAKALLIKIKEENEKNLEELPKYPKPKVDRDAELKEAGEVLMDTEQDIPYDTLMTKVDVKYGKYGMNNFYKMQVVFAKGKDMYILLTRWGRIGDQGQFQRTPYGTKEEAVTEFCKIFKSKSGNAWSQVKEFVKQPDKYVLVRTDPYYDRRSVKDVHFDFNKAVKPSKLHPGVQELLQTLTSPAMLKHAMKQSGASQRFLPFGHLQRDVLDQASQVLKKIQLCLEKLAEFGEQEAQKIHDEMAALSSEFYMLIPNDSFTHESMEPINDTKAVKKLVKHLDDMADLELTGNLMLAAQNRIGDMNPFDYIYRSLECEIEPLEEDETMAQLILQQIHQTKTYRNVKVQRIYRLRREGEEDRLASCNLSQHKMLWHGTKPFNVLSILKRGLLTLPLGVVFTGKRLGCGLYHSDAMTMSLHYTGGTNSACQSSFLFLNEVAMGNMKEAGGGGDAVGYDGVIGIGNQHPDPNQDLLLPTGVVFPMGKMIRNPQAKNNFSYNEFVVYEDKQVCLRYLVQIEPVR